MTFFERKKVSPKEIKEAIFLYVYVCVCVCIYIYIYSIYINEIGDTPPKKMK